MPIVTAIQRQKRAGSNRFNIAIDGTFSFAITDLDLSTSGLRVGQELTQQEVDDFRGQAATAKAYALAVRFVGIRLRSRREITDYLRRKGFEDFDIEATLERLAGIGLVDDVAFAAAWVADRRALRPRSRLRLAQELAAKGVSREVADVAIGAGGAESEIAALKELIQRKARQTAYQDSRKLQAYLQRQGYPWSAIRQAYEELDKIIEGDETAG